MPWWKFHAPVTDEHEAQKRNWADIITLFVLTLTWIAFIVYTVLTHRQSVLTKRALQTNARMARVAEQTNKDALDLARTNFVKDQRPYIWLSELEAPTVKPGQRVLWKFRYTNFGKSPAIAVHSKATVLVGKDGTQRTPADFFKITNNTGGTIIPPGDKTLSTTAYSDTSITARDLADIESNPDGLVLLVYFEYSDSSKTPYRSEICRVRLKTGAIAECKNEHNKIE